MGEHADPADLCLFHVFAIFDLFLRLPRVLVEC
jgi:hypothetical protein